MIEEMRSIIILGTIFIALTGILPREVDCRAIDDFDNGVEISNDATAGHQNLFEAEDWVKVVTAPPEKIIQNLGSTIELTCEIMGAPLPKIHWIRGHPTASAMENFESNVLSETSSSSIIRVKSVLVIDHILPNERTYTCVGQSSGQTVFATTTIYPSPDLDKSQQLNNNNFNGPKKPKIIYNYRMVLDSAGSNVILPCKAIGRSRPEIYWMDSNGVITGEDPRFKVLPSGDLLISDLRWADMGSYKCIARNSVGKDIAETFIYPVSKEE